jgi:hypothetical protein
MKNITKGKFGTAIILFFTVILAGVAIFTAFRLYQLRSQPVAPNVPSSIPKAQVTTTAPTSACSLSFTISATTTPTPTGTSTATPTPTGTSTATPTPTGTPNSCNGTCGSNSNCNSGLYCYIESGKTTGYCRNTSCPTDTDCVCSGTATPTATPAALPQSGTGWPTIAGMGVGILIILGSILLAI